MAGRQHQDQLRIGGEQLRPRFEERGFFAVQRAAGHEEAAGGGQGFQQTGGFGLLRGAHVEFQVAGDCDPLGDGSRWP